MSWLVARTVSDAAYVLSVIAGKDPYDNYTLAQPFDSPPDYTQSLNFSSLRGARIGIPRNGLTPDNTSQPILDAFEAAIQVIKNAGAIIVDNANFSAWDEFVADANAPLGSESIVLDADFVSDLSNYLAQLTSNPNEIHGLADEANFTHTFKLEDYPIRDTAVWDQALSLGYNSSDYRFWQAYQHTSYLGGEGGVTGALAAFNLDALILPTDYSPSLPAYAGLPVVTVPMGYYPPNSSVTRSEHWKLVEVGPNIPYETPFQLDLQLCTDTDAVLVFHSWALNGLKRP
jgi:amidase